MYVVNGLVKNQLFAAADALLREWWNELGKRQRDENIKFHRATAAFMLMNFFLGLGDAGCAFRWALLTHADDILGEHQSDGAAGKERLLTLFGISQTTVILRAVQALTF